MDSWLHLIEQALWPAVVLVLGLVLRSPLASALGSIVGRLTKVSVMSVSVELAVAKPIDPPWRGIGGDDVRGLVIAQQVNDSYFMTLREALRAPGSADYVVVDLRADGDEWLTSRLYLFSYLLSRLKGVRTVVFVATRGDVASAFLGSAASADVMRALAAAQPWLREARLHAEAGVVGRLPNPPMPPPDPTMASPSPVGDIDEWWNNVRIQSVWADPLQLAQAFLARVQWQQPPSQPDPGSQWLQLPAQPDQRPTWEHATWIRSSDLTNGLLRSVVEPESFVIDDPSWVSEERVRAIVQAVGDDVALCSPAQRFRQLVDRRALLTRVGETAVRSGHAG